MPAAKTAITFRQYLSRRGYNYLTFGEVMLRMIKKSFSEKSFCRFWRMWNPLTGYLFFLVYSFLSGNRKRSFLIFIVFIFSGLAMHDFIIFLLTGSVSIVFTVTFTLYSFIFSIEERITDRKKNLFVRRRPTRPSPIHYFVLLNMALLSLPLVAGFIVNYYVFPESALNDLFK